MSKPILFGRDITNFRLGNIYIVLDEVIHSTASNTQCKPSSGLVYPASVFNPWKQSLSISLDSVDGLKNKQSV